MSTGVSMGMGTDMSMEMDMDMSMGMSMSMSTGMITASAWAWAWVWPCGRDREEPTAACRQLPCQQQRPLASYSYSVRDAARRGVESLQSMAAAGRRLPDLLPDVGYLTCCRT